VGSPDAYWRAGPNANKLRALVVPQEPEAPEAKPAECEANCAHQGIRSSKALGKDQDGPSTA
jgi:hypothetical protein